MLMQMANIFNTLLKRTNKILKLWQQNVRYASSGSGVITTAWRKSPISVSRQITSRYTKNSSLFVKEDA
jgi:hypothetical protein